MIYKGLGFLAIVGVSTSSPSPPLSKLDRRHTGRLRKRDNLLTGEGWGGWERSQNSTKASKPGLL
jgi:hypothetical protein